MNSSVPPSVPGGRELSLGPGPGSSTTSTVKPKAKPKARHSEKPGVISSKCRKDTTKMWAALPSTLESALSSAASVMQECIKLHDGSEETARAQEPSYRVLESRAAALHMLNDKKQEKASAACSQKIAKVLEHDEWFNEQAYPMECLQTLGQMTYVRHTLLELQGTASATMALADQHRTSVEILKAVADSIIREGSNWRANVAALRKARDEEQKALVKEQKKLEAKQKAKEKQEQAKAAREAKKKEAAKEKADKQGAGVNEVADDAKNLKKKHYVNKTAGDQLSDTDPAILQSLMGPDWPRDAVVPIFETLPELAQHITKTAGMLAGMVRFRRSGFKILFEACVVCVRCC